MTSNRQRHSSIAGRRRRNTISDAFSGHTIEMLNSPAWRVLGLAARRVIDRVSIELRYHGGHQKNGLPVTYKQFMDYGIGDPHTVAAGIREAEALGFLEIIRRGRAGNAEHREPSRYRLTFEHHTDCEPENFRWRKIRELADAEQRKAQARAAIRRKQKPVRFSTTKVGVENHTGLARVSTTENRNSLGVENHTTSNIWVRGGRSGGGGGRGDTDSNTAVTIDTDRRHQARTKSSQTPSRTGIDHVRTRDHRRNQTDTAIDHDRDYPISGRRLRRPLATR